MGKIEEITAPDQMRKRVMDWKKKGLSVGFVPTMGFLHEGHLSLLSEASKNCDRVVLSIFVNPTQFGEGEDFETYPRDFQRDIDLAATKDVDAVFFPSVANIYPKNYQTYVELENLPNFLCGKKRDGHFRGVSTIVTKLFNIVCPDMAFFGEKDYQQLAVIRQMEKDLNFGIDIVGVPIVREEDGLAMSSRNTYLSKVERKEALKIYKSLKKAKELVLNGEKSSKVIIDNARKNILSYEDAQIDYINICNPDSLEDVETIEGSVLMAMAVFMGKTRLIDNIVINPS